MNIDLEVTLRGPMFDGRAAAELADLAADVASVVVDQASAEWHRLLDANIQYPTPYYETQLLRTSRGLAEVVTDRGIVYGPWLEGTSRRNQTTRFKGYHSARDATAAVVEQIPALAAPVVARHLAAIR
jgi:hypothetical protein